VLPWSRQLGAGGDGDVQCSDVDGGFEVHESILVESCFCVVG